MVPYLQIKSVKNHINMLRNRNYMLISIELERAFDIIQHCFMTKTLDNLGMEVTFLKMKETIHHTHPTYSQCHTDWKKLKIFLIRSGAGWRYAYSLLVFNKVLEVSARTIRVGERKKVHHRGGSNADVCRWHALVKPRTHRHHQVPFRIDNPVLWNFSS